MERAPSPHKLGLLEENTMNVTRKIIAIDDELCDGCGNCVPSCAEGAIEIQDGKARLVAEKYCDGLGACLGECPTGALKIIEREAEEFDEEAVEDYLKRKEESESSRPSTIPAGCPSATVSLFRTPGPSERTPSPEAGVSGVSALTHWPVQIRLVPPTAPFLKGAHLLVAADCAPVAHPRFHQDFLEGKTVLLGCPKFDDVNEYVQRFADIFAAAEIRKVTVVDMEVPCCSALPRIVHKGMEMSGKNIPMEEVVIARNGDILRKHSKAS